MTAKKSTAKSAEKKNYSRSDRRTHCIVDSLPAELQLALEKMLIDKAWPCDFGEHYDGFPRYTDAIFYCKQKGFVVSGSAIGRFALRVQTASVEEIKTDMKGYVLACLTKACIDFADVQGDLHKAAAHPERIPHIVEHLAELKLLAKRKITYIEKIIKDLKRLE